MITYTTYRRTEGTGPDWACSVTVNGKARIFCTAISEEKAKAEAKAWHDANFDTPALREKRAANAEKARANRKKGRADG